MMWGWRPIVTSWWSHDEVRRQTDSEHHTEAGLSYAERPAGGWGTKIQGWREETGEEVFCPLNKILNKGLCLFTRRIKALQEPLIYLIPISKPKVQCHSFFGTERPRHFPLPQASRKWAQCFHFLHLLMMWRLTAKCWVLSAVISHQDCRKGAETLAPSKLKTAAAHIVTTWIQLPSSAWVCQAVMLFWLIMNLNRVLSKSSSQSLSIYHASLDKAEWCFPPALTCFRNADLVKASPSHFFFDI